MLIWLGGGGGGARTASRSISMAATSFSSEQCCVCAEGGQKPCVSVPVEGFQNGP